MKKYINGEYIELTAEEIEEMKAEAIDTEPSLLERLEAIEAVLLEGVLNNG